jgi:hypothetical protein
MKWTWRSVSVFAPRFDAIGRKGSVRAVKIDNIPKIRYFIMAGVALRRIFDNGFTFDPAVLLVFDAVP